MNVVNDSSLQRIDYGLELALWCTAAVCAVPGLLIMGWLVKHWNSDSLVPATAILLLPPAPFILAGYLLRKDRFSLLAIGIAKFTGVTALLVFVPLGILSTAFGGMKGAQIFGVLLAVGLLIALPWWLYSAARDRLQERRATNAQR